MAFNFELFFVDELFAYKVQGFECNFDLLWLLHTDPCNYKKKLTKNYDSVIRRPFCPKHVRTTQTPIDFSQNKIFYKNESHSNIQYVHRSTKINCKRSRIVESGINEFSVPNGKRDTLFTQGTHKKCHSVAQSRRHAALLSKYSHIVCLIRKIDFTSDEKDKQQSL